METLQGLSKSAVSSRGVAQRVQRPFIVVLKLLAFSLLVAPPPKYTTPISPKSFAQLS